MVVATLTELSPLNSTDQYRIWQTGIHPVAETVDLQGLDPTLSITRIGILLFSDEEGETPAAGTGTYVCSGYTPVNPQVRESLGSAITAATRVTLSFTKSPVTEIRVVPTAPGGAATHYQVRVSQSKRYE
jgi:hypothetical protein